MSFLPINDKKIPLPDTMLFLILVFWIGLLVDVASQDNAPKIEFEKREVDLGIIQQGVDVEFEYPFKNTGTADLEIFHLRSLCDCIDIRISRQIVPPGEKEVVSAVFHSSGRFGKQDKISIIKTNDPVEPTISLKTYVEIESGIQVAPKVVAFREINAQKKIVERIKLDAELEQKLRITGLDVRGPKTIEAKLKNTKHKAVKLPDGQNGYHTSAEIELSVEKEHPYGAFSGKLIINTDYIKSPKITVLYSGEKTGAIHPKEKIAFFRNIAPGTKASVEIQLNSVSKDKFRITGIDPEKLPIELIKSESAASYVQKATLQFSAPESAKRFYRGFVYLLTDHPMQKRVKVAVNATVKNNSNPEAPQ